MNRDEIQKLIGGYATGSLTDEERRQLLEATLDDQELFDQLQGEQALKELLDDPISREQIRLAVAETLPRARSSWFGRPWIWAAAGMSVAAAAVLLVVLVQKLPRNADVKPVVLARQEAPALPQPAPETRPAPIETPRPAPRLESRRTAAKQKERPPAPMAVASPIPPPAPAAAQPAPEQTKSESVKAAEKDVVLTPPPPAPVQQQQAIVSQAQVPMAQTQDTKGVIAPPPKPAQAFRARTAAGGVPGGAMKSLAFRAAEDHSFAKRMEDGSYVNLPAGTALHSGETIRLTIVPREPGPIVLSEWDVRTSLWNRLFPAEGATVQVTAGERYTVPVDIVVKSRQRLRVTVGQGAYEIPLDVR